MLENVLERKKCSLSVKITVKTLVSALIIALAVALPQLVHLAAGSEGGMRYLPMYLPVLMGGCLLGVWWGIGVGALLYDGGTCRFCRSQRLVFQADNKKRVGGFCRGDNCLRRGKSVLPVVGDGL